MENSAPQSNSGNPSPAVLSIPMAHLSEGGLEPQVQSWLGNGSNEPLTAEQVTAVIGEDQLAQAAETLGKGPGDLAAGIAAELPGLVDAASPDGRLSLNSQGRALTIRVLPADMTLETVIAPAQGLSLNQEVPLDGSVTLDIRYL
ncbi:YidB family protein [Streptomyces sp. NPDC057966]|uniref:YidB family protein n=1 Tax=Streptomyces sp. NPDC057966 TaxID=3346292 RepID=UPI0036E16EFC